LNPQGSLDGEVELAVSSITGSYTLEVYTSNDVLLGSKNFNIEEFVPDRIKVTTKLDKPSLEPGQTTNMTINAVNFLDRRPPTGIMK
jgi:alpha-2-macroglobulin